MQVCQPDQWGPNEALYHAALVCVYFAATERTRNQLKDSRTLAQLRDMSKLRDGVCVSSSLLEGWERCKAVGSRHITPQESVCNTRAIKRQDSAVWHDVIKLLANPNFTLAKAKTTRSARARGGGGVGGGVCLGLTLRVSKCLRCAPAADPGQQPQLALA